MSNKEIFTPDSKTLREIFGNTDSFYSVPDYQRPYRWQDEQVDQLWEDLHSSYSNWREEKKNDDSYFLGSIILIKGKDHYDLVDGQQRLTTLTILFSVVRDLFPDLKDETTNAIKNSIKNIINGKQRLRFTTAIDKQNEFEQTIINGINFPEKFRAADKKKYPYINTAILFKEKLSRMNAVEVEKFLNYIFDYVCLISITCHSPSFAIRLFQVLNARGLDLSASDLIKSYLMNKLPDDKLREQFITSWRQIEGISADVHSEMDVLLNYYLYAIKGANPEKGLFEELTQLLAERDANSVVYDLKKFCEAYKEIYNSQDKTVYALFYLRHELYWKSILTSAKTNGFVEFNGLAKCLRNYYFIHWIAGYSSVKIKQPSFRLLQMVNGKDGAKLTDIRKSLSEQITNEVKRRFKQALINDVYREQWLKPLLLVLEYGQVEQALSYLELDSSIHVEHVLPEKYQKHLYWTKLFSQPQAELYLNTLANLTLLSGKQNIAASNSPFPEKISVYEGRGRDGLVPFRLSQWLRDRQSQGAKDWDLAAMSARFDWIIGSISKEFDIDLSDVKFDNIGESIEDVGTIENELELEEDLRAQAQANFHPECIEFLSKIIGERFEKISVSLYKSSSRTVVCRVSREYDKSKKGYWFAFTLELRDVLKENPEKNILVLGCGKPEKILAIPGAQFLPHIDSLNTTVRPDQTYWHIHIDEDESRYFLRLRGGDRVDVSSFIVSKSTRLPAS